jgi:hypothetical protein
MVASASLVLAALLLIGALWTPVAGGVVAADAISEILWRTSQWPSSRTTIGCALTMPRPGRLSIDARLVTEL